MPICTKDIYKNIPNTPKLENPNFINSILISYGIFIEYYTAMKII